MATSNNYDLRSKTKLTQTNSEEPPSTPPRSKLRSQKISQKKVTKVQAKVDEQSIELIDKLSKSIEELLISCTNDEFRKECFGIIGVDNGEDAGIKTKELALSFKGKCQRKRKISE